MSDPTQAVQRQPRLRRAPAVTIAAALVGGIVAGRYLPFAAALYASTLAISFAVAAVMLARRHDSPASVAIAVAIASAGAMGIHVCYFRAPDADISHFSPDEPILATVQGRVAEVPMIVEPDGDQLVGSAGPRTRFAMDVQRVNTAAGWADCTGRVQVSIDGRSYDLRPGQLVELPGWLGRYGPADNPGQFDWQEAARLRGVSSWLTVPTEKAVTVISNPIGLRGWLWRWRCSMTDHLADVGSGQSSHVLVALLIGPRHPSLQRLSQAMVRGGIAHMLSISGQHLSIVFGFIFLVARLAGLSPSRSAWLVLVLLLAYVLLAQPQAPLLRSAVMAAAVCAATISHRRCDVMNALAVAAVILLVADPRQLFLAGFQLSFVIVGGLMLLYQPMMHLLFGRYQRLQGLKVFRQDGRRWRFFIDRSGRWLRNGVAISLAAWLVSVPLVAIHFGLLSLLAPLLSLALVPLLAMVLVPGYVSMALAAILPNLSWQIGRVAALSAAAFSSIISAVDRLVPLSIYLRPVGMAWVVSAYICLAALMFLRARRGGRAILAASLVAFIALSVWTQRPADKPPAAHLDLLAVGAGQCAILTTPQGHTVVFDAGTLSDWDINQQIIRPFIHHQRLSSPRAAFISHANTDHFNAIGAIMDDAPLKVVYLNHYFGVDPPVNPAAADMVAQIADRRVQVLRLAAGDVVPLDDRTSVQVLWPPADPSPGLSANDKSLVLRIQCDDRSVLLTGDLDHAGQAALAAQPDKIGCDILLVPHHGGWEDVLPAFVTASNASVLLCSNSSNTRPPTSIVRAENFYESLKGRRFYTTARNGWIGVSFGRGRIDVQTMRE